MGRKINVVGWYGRGNCGDEAFKAVHSQLFPDCEIDWICGGPQRPDDGAVWVLGGGDVFLDYYINQIPDHVPFFVYGVGLGSPDQRQHMVALKDRLLGVWLRNADDVEALNELGVPARYSPDIVFQLADAIQERPLPPVFEVRPKKTLVFIPSNNASQTAMREDRLANFFYYSYMKIKLGECLDEIAKYYEIVMLPFSFDMNDMDMSFITDVRDRMKRHDRLQVIRQELDPLDAGRVIAQADLVMSMKFHGLIFALMNGVPFVNIGLTRKTQLLCEDNGLGRCSVQPFSLSAPTLMAALKEAERSETRLAVADRASMLIMQAKEEGELFRNAVLAASMQDLAA